MRARGLRSLLVPFLATASAGCGAPRDPNAGICTPGGCARAFCE